MTTKVKVILGVVAVAVVVAIIVKRQRDKASNFSNATGRAGKSGRIGTITGCAICKDNPSPNYSAGETCENLQGVPCVGITKA